MTHHTTVKDKVDQGKSYVSSPLPLAFLVSRIKMYCLGDSVTRLESTKEKEYDTQVKENKA
jgi:hypothetical protein